LELCKKKNYKLPSGIDNTRQPALLQEAKTSELGGEIKFLKSLHFYSEKLRIHSINKKTGKNGKNLSYS